ncbi:MAG: hypothetical protein FJ206_01220 [Gemmatimonadetes bacterium]|nr:hypothetical protein [Gemmatimonadota bacterium]
MRKLAWVVPVAVVAACSDGTGPGGDQGEFNARQMTDGVATIERVSAAPVLASFRNLAGQIPGSVPAGASAAGRLIAAVQDIATLTRPALGGPNAIPVIRPSVFGKTFVYDPATKEYVVSSRAGAPANGVRFILYREGEQGRPNPAQEIGYADLTDEKASSATSAGLKLKVVSGSITHLEYSFDLSGSISNATVKVVGYLSDGTERINFDLSTNGQLFGRGGTATIEGKIEVPSQRFSVEAKLVGQAGESGGAGQIDLRVKAGDDVLVIKVTGSAGAINATITANGKLFATVTGTAEKPVIKGEGGRDLTAEELEALGAVVKFAEGVFELIGGLLAPAGVLLLIGLGI